MTTPDFTAGFNAGIAAASNGGRQLPFDRDQLGRFVREAWCRWAKTQAKPKPSWLAPYDELSEEDKEADRQIGEAIARWTLIGDAAAISALTVPSDMVAVPREPTQEMLVAMAAAARDFYSEKGLYPRSKAIYRAMLAVHEEKNG